jgi:hypothetical protein
MRAALLLALILPLAACAGLARETREERDARLAADCTAAGFTAASDAYRLCLLLQATNERLAYVERRLAFIEQDVRFAPRAYPFW